MFVFVVSKAQALPDDLVEGDCISHIGQKSAHGNDISGIRNGLWCAKLGLLTPLSMVPLHVGV